MWFEKPERHRGWRPISWQGWLIASAALGAVIIASARIDETAWFIVALVAIVSTLAAVSYAYSR